MISSIDLSQDMVNICNSQYTELLSLPGVVGIALSYKVIDNQTTDMQCIQVLIEKKLPLNKLSIHHMIPKTYKGFITDVFETGIIESYLNSSYMRPFNCGYSVGLSHIGNTGTAGAIVKSKLDKDDNYYVLSNNHVLARENTAPIGSSILQPSQSDGGLYPEDIIANLSRFIPIEFINNNYTPTNTVDCAIAEINNISLASPYISGIGLPRGIRHPFIGQLVRKSGRSTGLTHGMVMSIGATIKVNYPYTKKKALFKNQIITTQMSLKGDSGSLLLDRYGMAIGLLFSGSKNVTLYNRINDVLSALNVTLVTNYDFAL
ncbi:hypothetical protein [Clostridium cylindrosporum]|uniref:Uncharacterized protein n=1 Tax=Clostridium cylindrosporum DSM 605 TaxID=1121307 RepID=A0A0J8D8H4_CLOCY|nr:hypothetical protein [Clostridium cylindrosporum]KMT22177.1 hypothetical protein CLCY_4c01500 [Clostridium cylindrosporum DSM 605]